VLIPVKYIELLFRGKPPDQLAYILLYPPLYIHMSSIQTVKIFRARKAGYTQIPGADRAVGHILLAELLIVMFGLLVDVRFEGQKRTTAGPGDTVERPRTVGIMPLPAKSGMPVAHTGLP